MLNTKDGDGIEIWVNMKEEDMTIFGGDLELLSYASSADGKWKKGKYSLAIFCTYYLPKFP